MPPGGAFAFAFALLAALAVLARAAHQWTSEETELADAVQGTYDAEATNTTAAAATASAAPSGCQLCRLREEMRNFSLETIKEHILTKLKIDKPITKGRPLPKVPSVLMEKYRRGDPPTHVDGVMQADQPATAAPDHDDYARTEVIVVFAQRGANQSHPKIRHSGKRRGQSGQSVLYFRLGERLRREQLDKALLWVHVRGASDPAPTAGPGLPVTVGVARLPPSDGAAGNTVTVKVSRSNDSEGSWVPLDVRKLVEHWLATRTASDQQLGVVVHASGPQDPAAAPNARLIDADPDDGDGSLVPFLEVFVRDGGERPRDRRSPPEDCLENSEETSCCRYPLTVDFEEFGWDWIIAPKKYEANYCSGECQMAFMHRYPHTYVSDFARRPNSAGPCCAPRRLTPISMLYFNPDLNIIYSLLPNMVVEKCGCS